MRWANGDFTTVEDLYKYLVACFKNPYEDEDAREELINIRIKLNETFNDFYYRILRLAEIARSTDSEIRMYLKTRSTPELQRATFAVVDNLKTLVALARKLTIVDHELRRLRSDVTKYTATRTGAPKDPLRIPRGPVPARAVPGVRFSTPDVNQPARESTPARFKSATPAA